MSEFLQLANWVKVQNRNPVKLLSSRTDVRLWSSACRLRAVEAGERRRLSGEASVWSWEAELQKLLVVGSAGDPEGLQGNTVHQGPQVRTRRLEMSQRRSSAVLTPPLPFFPHLVRWLASHRVTSSARFSRSTWSSTGRASMWSAWRPNWWRSTWRAPSTRSRRSQVSAASCSGFSSSRNPTSCPLMVLFPVCLPVDTMCLKWAPPKNKQAKLSKKWRVCYQRRVTCPSVHLTLLCSPGDKILLKKDSLYISVCSICLYFLKYKYRNETNWCLNSFFPSSQQSLINHLTWFLGHLIFMYEKVMFIHI